jgi:chemotaxis protein CheX
MSAAPAYDFPFPGAAELASLVEQVWSSFVGEEISIVELRDASDSNEVASTDRMVASVSITGPWCGHLTIAISPEAAGEVAAAMFMTPADEMDPSEITDAFGEMANVAGGNVKAMLPEPSALSLPQVVVEAKWISLFSATHCGTAVMQWRDFLMDVSLWESSRLREPLAKDTDSA